MASEGFTILDETLERLKALLSQVKDPVQDDWDPLEFSILFAKLEYEDIDVADYLKRFRELSLLIKDRLGQQLLHREKVQRVLEIFSKDLEFQGDKNNYYNIKNSFTTDVLLRRKGIPISLSLIFMGLCREVGLKSVGIGFPGHFLVKVIPSEGYFEASGSREQAEDWQNQLYIDCFEGALLSVKDCEDRLRAWTRGVIPFGPDALKVTHPVDILSRMLRNLRAILMEKEDLPRLYWVLTALIELCPQDRIEGFRERGLLMGRMGRFAAARKDLEEFLNHSQDVEKLSHVQRLLSLFSGQSEYAN